MGSLINLQGLRFGKWVVVRRADNCVSSWVCVCDCGTERTVRSQHLRTGASTCCRCVRVPKKHGEAVTWKKFSKKYRTWRQIKRRCCGKAALDPLNTYAGMLYKEWETYTAFAQYMPDPPSDEHTIDRIDNSKGYEPGNVRWATWTEQHRNQTNCKWITFNEETKLLTDWARELNITPSSLLNRLEKWALEAALTTAKGAKQND